MTYEEAFAIWLSRKMTTSKGQPFDPKYITDVEFSTVGNGGCTTCWIETAGITFKYRGSWKEEELTYLCGSPAQMIDEVSRIFQEGLDGL